MLFDVCKPPISTSFQITHSDERGVGTPVGEQSWRDWMLGWMVGCWLRLVIYYRHYSFPHLKAVLQVFEWQLSIGWKIASALCCWVVCGRMASFCWGDLTWLQSLPTPLLPESIIMPTSGNMTQSLERKQVSFGFDSTSPFALNQLWEKGYSWDSKIILASPKMPNHEVQMISRRRSKIGRGFQIALVLASILVALGLQKFSYEKVIGAESRWAVDTHFQSISVILQIRIYYISYTDILIYPKYPKVYSTSLP